MNEVKTNKYTLSTNLPWYPDIIYCESLSGDVIRIPKEWFDNFIDKCIDQHKGEQSMDNQEYERRELITDWSTVKQGDTIIDNCGDCHIFLCLDSTQKDSYGDCIIVKRNYIIQHWGLHGWFRALPKKKKVVKYLYEYIGRYTKTKHTTQTFFKDDNDFINSEGIEGVLCFNRLDWTAQPFDE